MRKSAPAKNVDEYLKRYPENVQAALEKVRQAIKKAAPKAEEVISYHIPTYKQSGSLVCFGGYDKHCSFYVISKNIMQLFAKELEPFETTGITIHFSPEKPIPIALIQKIVKIRIKQNEGSPIPQKSSKSK